MTDHDNTDQDDIDLGLDDSLDEDLRDSKDASGSSSSESSDTEPAGSGREKVRAGWRSLKPQLVDARDRMRAGWESLKPQLVDAGERGREAWTRYRAQPLPKQAKIGVGVLLAILVAAAALFGWVPTTQTAIFGTAMIGAFAAGLLGIPGFIFLFGKSLPAGLRGVLTRILWTIATLAQGGQILRHNENGEYRTYAPERDADGTVYIQADNGERVDIETPGGHWFRLGKKQFGITYQKTEAMFGDLLANFDKEHIAESTPEGDRRAYADGGHGRVALLDMVRGGYQAFTQYTGYLSTEKTQGEDGWVLRADKAASRKRGAGGRGQAGKAKEQTLKEHGGNTAAIQSKWFYIAFLGALLVGALSAYLAVGL